MWNGNDDDGDDDDWLIVYVGVGEPALPWNQNKMIVTVEK